MNDPPDLAELADVLARLPAAHREELVVGKTACRDALVDHLGCSEERAEALVETMISRGILVFERGSGRPPGWTVVKPGR